MVTHPISPVLRTFGDNKAHKFATTHTFWRQRLVLRQYAYVWYLPSPLFTELHGELLPLPWRYRAPLGNLLLWPRRLAVMIIPNRTLIEGQQNKHYYNDSQSKIPTRTSIYDDCDDDSDYINWNLIM